MQQSMFLLPLNVAKWTSILHFARFSHIILSVGKTLSGDLNSPPPWRWGNKRRARRWSQHWSGVQLRSECLGPPIVGSARPARSSRSAAAAPAGTDPKRCICAPPAASAERLTAAPATGRAALFPPPPPARSRLRFQSPQSQYSQLVSESGLVIGTRQLLVCHL